MLHQCSEAHGFNADWPSDITLFVNHIRVGTVTSPGDYGGEKGRLTPNWWIYGSQYGDLYEWRFDADGCFANGIQIAKTTLSDLQLSYYEPIILRFEVEHTATNCRGMNLFGSTFGNYEQDIKMTFIKKDIPKR